MRGVIPNSFEHIFQHISRSQDQQYLVRASYLEIYMEEIRDLLSKDQSRRLELKERPDTGVYVKVCTENSQFTVCLYGPIYTAHQCCQPLMLVWVLHCSLNNIYTKH